MVRLGVGEVGSNVFLMRNIEKRLGRDCVSDVMRNLVQSMYAKNKQQQVMMMEEWVEDEDKNEGLWDQDELEHKALQFQCIALWG